MNRNLRTQSQALTVGVVLLLAGISTAFAAVDTDSQDRLDARVSNANRETRILASFYTNPRLRAYDLTVIVDGNKAVLSGVVEDAAGKDVAQRIATDVDGITSVENRIAIDAAYARINVMERGFDGKIEDARITATIASSLSQNSATDGLDIHVDTHNGQVTLTGIARNLGQKEQAGRIAMLTNGVVTLSNDIVVGTKADALDKLKGREPQSAQAVSDLRRAENGEITVYSAVTGDSLPLHVQLGDARATRTQSTFLPGE